MAPYNYNNYYDPVGSQSSNQPQGYTYRANTSSQYPGQATSNYPANYNQSYDDTYGNQQYSANTQQATPATSSTNRNATSLNSLTNPTYNQNSTSNRSSSNIASSYDTNTYYASAGFAALNDRNQSNNSPLYSANTGTGASTFGRLTLPEQSQSQSQSSSNTFGATQSYQNTASNASTQYRNAPSTASSNHRNYKTAYNQTQNQTQPPQRYASPLHAVQAQQHHGHNKQPSRSSNPQPSPQMSSVQHVQQQENQYQRQTSASVEPSPTTVDPTQVYDFRAEQQRKAQAEAEKRKKREAERAARKAEEDARRQEEERRVAEATAKKEEQERAEREKQETEEKAKKAEEEATKKKAAQARKNEERRKAREEKRQSQTAATALTQMAFGSAADAALAGMPGVGDMSGPRANDEEAEMRAMFKKMREFNARNPDMLAKLWEEERRSHAEGQSSPPQPPATKPTQSAPANKKQPAANARPATAQQGQHVRPFKPAPAVAPSKAAARKSAAPSAQQANGALWPPDKKGSLAEAAAKWLNNLPQNRSLGRSVSREQVLKILDGNPAYVQLCESLEHIGIRFGRSDLAQELLKAVPEVRQQKPGPSTTNGQATAAAAAGSPLPNEAQKKKGGRPRKDQPGNYSVTKPSQGNGPVSYQAPVFSLANAAREVNSMDTSATGPSSLASAIACAQGPSDLQSPYFTDHPMVETDDPPPAVEVKDEEKPEEPPKPPADKEEAARKRTFNDLVDLTKDNDDSDDEGPPRKIQQPLVGPSNGAVKHQQPPQSNGFSKPMTFQQFLNRTQPVQTPAPYQPYQTSYGGSVQRPRPMMPPASMLPSQPKPSGPTEEQKQQDRMRGKMLVEPIMRDRVARKSKYDSRTIARDVLLATGRHPDMRPLNAHLSSMQRLLADHGGAVDGAGNKSDLSTIKWDVIDPGEPAEDAKAKAKAAAERRQKAIADAAGGDVDEEADDESEGLPSRAEEALRKVRNGEELRKEELSNIDPMVRKQIKNRLKVRKQSEKFREGTQTGQREGLEDETTQDKDDPYVSVQQQIRKSANPKRPRGRPPKSATNSALASPAVNNDDSDNTNTNNDILGSDLTPNRRRKASVSKSSPSMASGTPAVGYAAFRQVDVNGNVIKKKGRPVGWRKSIHSREANGLEVKSSASKPTGSRLRQSIGATQKPVEPEYQIYKCRWSGCSAQLDNLERLKKHVVKLHGSQTADDRFECQWQPCQSQGKHVDADGKSRAIDNDFASFDDMAHWMKHVNKEHLDEVAWKLGDGPRGGSVSEIHTDSEAYLSDAHGRQVTPMIVPMPETVNESSSPETKEQKELRQAAAELKKLTDQKRREGLTMGREGSRLATDKRRRGFLDDEDFEDVIYDSD